jgi:hypothetical protein
VKEGAMNFNPQDLISRHNAVKEIAKRIHKNDQTKREADNRISHQLSYAVKIKKLPAPVEGMFCFNDIALWAQQKWPGKFDDWPSNNTINANLELPIFKGVATGFSSLLTIEECHREIERLHAREVELAAQLQTAQAEIERLRPDAEKWKTLVEKNRQSGKAKKYHH